MNKKQLIVAWMVGVSFMHLNISLAQPNIEVTEIITGENPSAVVNGRIVEIGDIKIVDITESLIKYEYDDRTYTKRLGEGIIKKDMPRKKTDYDLLSILKFSVVKFEWDWISYGDECLFSPLLIIKVTNTSNQPLDSLLVNAIFIDKTKKEIFGEDSEYGITSSDIPLKPNYSKIFNFSAGVGYKHCLIRKSYPTITAEIYVNNKFYTGIKMSSKDWHSLCLIRSCE